MRARDNPFRSERVERLVYRAERFDWKLLEARLTEAGGRGAIVGPQGHGKTTLLLEWMARFGKQGSTWIRLSEGQRSLHRPQKSALSGAQRIFLDGAEQLGWWGWRDFLRRSRKAKTLIITSHRPGLLPTLFSCQTSPQLLAELVTELQGESLPVEALWQRHEGNIRLALAELYDRWAKRPAPGVPGHDG